MGKKLIKAGRWCWELPLIVKCLAINAVAYAATIAVILTWYV